MMKKRCNVICVLVLAALAFFAQAPISRWITEDQHNAVGVGSANAEAISSESRVVEGSFSSRNVPQKAKAAKTRCGVEKKDNYSNIVVPLAKQNGIDWRLVTAIMAAESSFNPCAVSPAGAMGLMQIMPAVAKDFEVKPAETFRPDENIRAGVLLLKRLNKKYKGNLKLTVAAYNAGPGNVDRYKGIPPFKETQNYVKKVLGYHSDLKVAKATPLSAAPMKLLKAR